MNLSFKKMTAVGSLVLAVAGFSSQAAADPLFFDDFEDRVKDQALVGPGWTWYNQTYSDDQCTEYSSGFGPYDDGNGDDYLQENRNYWTASVDVGQGDSYFRAGLEVPAWATDDGEKVVLSNMLRVYGDQYYAPGVTTCKRTLVFQEMTARVGSFTFSFDTAMDRFGSPVNGEVTGAFVKVIKTSDLSYNELIFEHVKTTPPVSSTPENASTGFQSIDFTVPPEMANELLQIGFYTDVTEGLGQGWGTSAVLYDNVMLAPMEIGPAHSGSFYNDGQSGHGFSIEFGYLADGTPFGVVYWYTYDDQGNPIFMLGNGVPNGQTLEVTLFSPTGMQYGVWQSPTENDGGTAVFNFSDRENATFSYTPSAFTNAEWGHTNPIVDLPLTKIFSIPADKYFNTSE
jgi:hypothetical protein